MAWTDGVDKATNDVVTATIWNGLLGATGDIMLVPQRAALVATPTSTTSTSAVDLVTISSLNIPVTAGIRITFNYRKQALAANSVGFGLKVNATVVVEATVSNSSVAHSTAVNQAEDGYCIIDITPRSASTYLMGGLQSMHGSKVSGTGAAGFPNATGASIMTAAMPNAAITSIAIRAINDTASNAAEITSVQIWQFGR